MSSILIILLLIILQFIAGFGLLTLLNIRLRPAFFLTVSIVLGIGIFSLVPFLLELMRIPVSASHIFIGIALIIILLNLKFKKGRKLLVAVFRQARFRVNLYEIPFLAIMIFMFFVSAWRCYYYPPTPRDLTSGAEVIAEYAVKEKTMINSVFTVDLSTTNNQFKPPYLTSLQVIYKYAGFPFGQVWLSTIYACFLIFLYHAISLKIHRLLAGFLLLCFMAIPEMYAYSFMALFDLSNAVFFTLSVFFLIDYFSTGKNNHLILSGLCMALATYARSETILLAGLLFLGLLWHHIKNWNSLTLIGITGLYFLLPCILIYLLTVSVYINLYLPVPYTVSSLINPRLFNPLAFFDRFAAVNTKLLIGDASVIYYGYFFYLFFILLVFDLVLTDKWTSEPRNWIFAILTVYFGLPLVGHILPLMDIEHSTKRGMFKIFPLILLYLGSSGLLTGFSEKIRNWEMK